MAGPILNAALGLAGALFGRQNSTRQQDWDRAVAQGSVRQYFPGGCPPDVYCGPGVAVGGFPGSSIPGAGSSYPLPVPVQSQQAFTPPAQMGALPIAYQPAMTLPGAALRALPSIPQLGTMAGRAVGGSLAALKKTLPTLRRDIAIASGFTIASGLVFDQSGNVIGKTRKRRRVNPLNYRAAMRAARRLCAVQDLTARISSALPGRSGGPRRARRCKTKRKCK